MAPAEGTSKKLTDGSRCPGAGRVTEAIPWLWGQEAVCTGASTHVSSGVRTTEPLTFQEPHPKV